MTLFLLGMMIILLYCNCNALTLTFLPHKPQQKSSYSDYICPIQPLNFITRMFVPIAIMFLSWTPWPMEDVFIVPWGTMSGSTIQQRNQDTDFSWTFCSVCVDYSFCTKADNVLHQSASWSSKPTSITCRCNKVWTL